MRHRSVEVSKSTNNNTTTKSCFFRKSNNKNRIIYILTLILFLVISIILLFAYFNDRFTLFYDKPSMFFHKNKNMKHLPFFTSNDILGSQIQFHNKENIKIEKQLQSIIYYYQNIHTNNKNKNKNKNIMKQVILPKLVMGLGFPSCDMDLFYTMLIDSIFDNKSMVGTSITNDNTKGFFLFYFILFYFIYLFFFVLAFLRMCKSYFALSQSFKTYFLLRSNRGKGGHCKHTHTHTHTQMKIKIKF